MLAATKRVLELHDNDEFEIFVVTGKNGYGKTTYANRIIAEVYSFREQKQWGGNGISGNWSLNLFKHQMGYHPEEVKNLWDKLRRRNYVFHWDDAGVWLSAYDHQDPYVKSIAKYLQTARTDFGCIIFSCIDKNDIISKIRNFKSTIIINITKDKAESNSPEPARRNRRKATAWHYWDDRLNKVGTENDWEEYFDSYVPGNYCADNPKRIAIPTNEQKKNPNITWGFYGWYKPKRDKYSRLAKQLANKKLEEKKKKDEL